MATNNDDKGIATPHDRLFHSVFEQTEQAAAYLQKALPTPVAQRIDWSTLEPMPQTVVDRALGKGRMDLVYTAKMGERSTILHLLWEHQSSADYWQALRCARYVLLWWDWWLGQRENKKAKTLPLVLPLVLYHGRQPWCAPTSLRDLIDVDADDLEGTGIVLPDFSYLVDDLTERSDPEIQALYRASLARLVIQLFKCVFTPDFAERFVQLLSEAPRWLRFPEELQILEPVILYGLQVAENLTAADLRRIERAWGPHAEGFVMTLAEQLHEEGRKEGLEEGRKETQRAVAQAVREAEQAAAQAVRDEREAAERAAAQKAEAAERAATQQAILDVFDARGMEVPAEVRDRIQACTSLQTLSEWHRRAVIAASAAEIFDV